jgi:deoxyribonuclease-1
MFYMEDTYGFRLSRQDRQLFTAWSRQDPPDTWEIERDRRIKAIQGLGNRFVEDYTATFGKTVTATPATPPVAPVPTVLTATPPTTKPTSWSCSTKKTTCRQMRSCDEAKFYLTQCGVSRLDGNNDGIPCASLCR